MNVPTSSTATAPNDPEVESCPCGSGSRYGQCCARYHRGLALAPTPEALMRSRYSAFALGGLGDYLIATWDPRSRDPELTAAQLDSRDNEWLGLEVVHAEHNGARGTVEFKARFRPRDASALSTMATLHERSRFRRIKGHWVYIDGMIDPPAPSTSRNAPCPCGSGKKAKRCCQC